MFAYKLVCLQFPYHFSLIIILVKNKIRTFFWECSYVITMVESLCFPIYIYRISLNTPLSIMVFMIQLIILH
nr:MAG TPA: hypothetical protein [Caudoviricetes sp.]